MSNQETSPLSGEDQLSMIDGLAAGDELAFEQFYRQYIGDLTRLAGYWLRHEDAEEVAHDVLLKAAREIKQYDASKASLSTWLVVACRNRSIDRVRTIRRENRVVVSQATDLAEMLAPDDPQHDVTVRWEIQSYWSQLSEKEREIVRLHFFVGLPYREVAELMGIQQSTIKEHIKRARAKLRKQR